MKNDNPVSLHVFDNHAYARATYDGQSFTGEYTKVFERFVRPLAYDYAVSVAFLPFPDELLKTNEREWLFRNTVRTHGRYTPDVATPASTDAWHGKERN